MIKILLDSSTSYLCVGVCNNDCLIDKIEYESWQNQSEMMVPELDKIMKKHNISRQDIDGVIVAIGPGSYTGVRIALSCAKVIAFALSVKLYPVSSLRILKDDNNPSICLINARNNRSYFGVYEKGQTIVEDCIKTNDEVLDYIAKHPNYVIKGDVDYLGFEKSDNDVIKQMFLLRNDLVPCSDILAIKPVYMKD